MKTAYCVQYGSRPSWIDELRTTNRDVFELCWSQDPVAGAIHYPKSTWTQGRNRLAQEVFATEARLRERYEYVLMSDDDIAFERMSHAEAFSRFEGVIDKYRPAVGVPNYCWHFFGQKHLDRSIEVQGIYATDMVLQALHRDTWPVLLPFWTEFDAQSWWNSGHVQNRIAGTTYPGAVVSVNSVFVINERASEYPRAGKCIAADNMLRELSLPTTAWHAHETKESFLPQPLSLKSHYRRTRDDLAKLWNMDHRYWTGRVPGAIARRIAA